MKMTGHEADSERISDVTPLMTRDKTGSQGCCHGFGKRYVLVVMGCSGFMIMFTLRVNLSVALVAMVNQTEVITHSHGINRTSEAQCPNFEPENQTYTWREEGTFNWTPEIQGLILSAFYYGYVTTHVIGGYLADRFGGKWLYGVGILTTSVLTILTPLAAGTSPYLLIGVRALEGIAAGIICPAMYSLFGKWAPNLERSFLMAIVEGGGEFGIIMAFPISGLLCEYGFSGGWPSVFYTFGTAGCVWFVFWSFLVYNSPADHPKISYEERLYIEASLGDTTSKTNIRVPWKHIILSVPVNALNITRFCSGWGFRTLLTSLPIYMKSILKLDITQNGMISALPYMVKLMMTVSSGYVADFLRRRQVLSTTVTRKIMTTLGMLIPSGALVGVTLVGCDRPAVILLLIVSVGFGGFCSAGYSVNQVDLAPNFSGIIMGISNTFGTIAGMVAPFVAGLVTNDGESRQEWNAVFLISAAISTLGVIVFTLLGSGEEQPWAKWNAQESAHVRQAEELTMK